MNKIIADGEIAISFDPLISPATLDPAFRCSRRYAFVKNAFDKTLAIVALPVIGTVCLILLVVNPILNPGPLFFRQQRMGRDCRRFRLWKFRTMQPADTSVRAHDAKLEEHRITWLGRFLRRTHIDELPNFINVLTGDISIVGPRPDAWEHAIVFISTVPHYKDRFRVRPGITGLAQVLGGYADEKRAIERKARLDLFYVKNSRLKLEAFIIVRTVRVLITGYGAR